MECRVDVVDGRLHIFGHVSHGGSIGHCFQAAYPVSYRYDVSIAGIYHPTCK